MATMVRYLDCILQTSTDGGVTWSSVPGWDLNTFGNCVRQNLPPPPPNPAGVAAQQEACNLSGYLASAIVDHALVSLAASFSSGLQNLQMAEQLFTGPLGIAFPITNLALVAATDTYQLYTTATIGALTASAADPALRDMLTCAIYAAIHNDGAVTDANYPALVAAACGITYFPTIAVTAICDFLTGLGSANLRALQVVGGLDVIDCTACALNWCNREDFTSGPGAFALLNIPPTVGVYSSATGWQSTVNGGLNKLYIGAGPSSSRTVTSMSLFVDFPTANATPGHRYVALGLGGSEITRQSLPDGIFAPGSRIDISWPSVVCDAYAIYVESAPGAPFTISAFQDAGIPPSPGLGAICI